MDNIINKAKGDRIFGKVEWVEAAGISFAILVERFFKM
jgi:hypothetical protein